MSQENVEIVRRLLEPSRLRSRASGDADLCSSSRL